MRWYFLSVLNALENLSLSGRLFPSNILKGNTCLRFSRTNQMSDLPIHSLFDYWLVQWSLTDSLPDQAWFSGGDRYKVEKENAILYTESLGKTAEGTHNSEWGDQEELHRVSCAELCFGNVVHPVDNSTAPCSLLLLPKLQTQLLLQRAAVVSDSLQPTPIFSVLSLTSPVES